jgi:hypothetical protein
MPKKKRPAPGAFVRLRLADGSFGYGRVRGALHVAFFDLRTANPVSDLAVIGSKPMLFTVAVRHAAFDSWDDIGTLELDEDLKSPIVQVMQDVGDFRRCMIFDTAGNEREATPEECVGLERSAVWEARNVEGRLLDHFLGRSNLDWESTKVRLQ